MKHPFGSLLLFSLVFVALSPNRMWSCGVADADHETKFHHAPLAANHHQTAKDWAHCAENKPDKPCSDEESGHCHCPICGLYCHAPVDFTPATQPAFSPLICTASMKRQAFYFADHLPETVYISIWQPPKLEA